MAVDGTAVAFTTSDRIRQLNDIDKDVVRLLQSAGLAVKALTDPGSASNGDSSNLSALKEQQKESFVAATSKYFALVSSLDVRLRRQIYALEEDDILPAEVSENEAQTNTAVPPGVPATAGGSTGPLSRRIGSGKGAITGGGLGSLDVGWLNSRNDRVGKEMEAKLWDQAREFVQTVQRDTARQEPESDTQIGEDVAMMHLPQAQHSSEVPDQP